MTVAKSFCTGYKTLVGIPEEWLQHNTAHLAAQLPDMEEKT